LKSMAAAQVAKVGALTPSDTGCCRILGVIVSLMI
jgi:hypothetical protein